MSPSFNEQVINMVEDKENVGVKSNITRLGQKFNVHSLEQPTNGKLLKNRWIKDEGIRVQEETHPTSGYFSGEGGRVGPV